MRKRLKARVMTQSLRRYDRRLADMPAWGGARAGMETGRWVERVQHVRNDEETSEGASCFLGEIEAFVAAFCL